MKQSTIVLLACLALAEPARLYAQEIQEKPLAPSAQTGFESPPTLDASITSVPRGILGFLNEAGQAVNLAEGNQPSPGNVVENLSGFSQTKRDLAIKLEVDPYCNSEVFRQSVQIMAKLNDTAGRPHHPSQRPHRLPDQ